MKISANAIRNGNILVYEKDLWVVSKTPEHTQPGKGGAYVQVEMKNLKTGTKVNKRFSSSYHIEKAHLEHIELQFLYMEDDNLILMDTQTCEQITVNKKLLDNKLPFLVDSMMLTVAFYQEEPLNIALPPTIIVEIAQTDPVIKGATATSSYKPAILTNNIKIMVPAYLVSGERIIIKTEDLNFVERAK